jgi:hypothetical protein
VNLPIDPLRTGKLITMNKLHPSDIRGTVIAGLWDVAELLMASFYNEVDA